MAMRLVEGIDDLDRVAQDLIERQPSRYSMTRKSTPSRPMWCGVQMWGCLRLLTARASLEALAHFRVGKMRRQDSQSNDQAACLGRDALLPYRLRRAGTRSHTGRADCRRQAPLLLLRRLLAVIYLETPALAGGPCTAALDGPRLSSQSEALLFQRA